MSHVPASVCHENDVKYGTTPLFGEGLSNQARLVYETLCKNSAKYFPSIKRIWELINGKNCPKAKIILGLKRIREALKELALLGFVKRIARKRDPKTGQLLKNRVLYKGLFPESLKKCAPNEPDQTPPNPSQGTQSQAIEAQECDAIATPEEDVNAVIEEALESEVVVPQNGREAPQEGRETKRAESTGEAIIRHNEAQDSPNAHGANVGEMDGVIIKRNRYNNKKIKSTSRDSSAPTPRTPAPETSETPTCSYPECNHSQIPHIDTGQGPHFCNDHRSSGLAVLKKIKSKRHDHSSGAGRPVALFDIVRDMGLQPQKTPETPHRAALSDITGVSQSNRADITTDEVKPFITQCAGQASSRNGDKARTGQGLRQRINETMQNVRRAYAVMRGRLC